MTEPTTDNEDRNILIEALWSAFAEDDAYVNREMDMIDASGTGVDMPAIADHVLARLQEKSIATRVLLTVEDLQAIPAPAEGALAGPLIKALGYPSIGEVFERNTDDTWCLLKAVPDGDEESLRTKHEDIGLPAILLWSPAVSSAE